MSSTTASPTASSRGAVIPTAVACLAAGARSLRANWQLVLVRWIQIAATALLTVAGLIPVVWALGLERVRAWVPRDPVALADRIEGLTAALATASWRDLLPRSPVLVAALLMLLGIWTAALVVYCWLQAGFYAVLVAAEQQARANRSPGAFGWRWLATAGRRCLWRFTGLLQVYLGYVLLAFLLATVPLGLAAAVSTGDGLAAALAGGCATVLLAAVAVALLTLWFGLAQADLAWPDSSLRAAHHRAFVILSGRFGPVLTLGLAFTCLGLAATVLLLPVHVWVESELGGSVGVWLGARLILEAVQWLLWALVLTFSAAALVALVGMERAAAEVPG